MDSYAALLRCPTFSTAGGIRRYGSGGVFADEGHLQYYAPRARCGGRTKEEKRRAKLMMGLSRDLSALSSSSSILAEDRHKIISEAAEILLAQLNQMRSEEKEMKRSKKEERKAAKKKDCGGDEEDSSSSSSSESSDSECETVVKMVEPAQAELTPAFQSTTLQVPCCNAAPLSRQLGTEVVLIDENLNPKLDSITKGGGANSCCQTGSAAVVGKHTDRIEVCMGGKCKKFGAMEILGEFERKLGGVQGAVVGCKCMGKCRDGPNVRVLNHNAQEDSSMPVENMLCIGVGLEDVNSIVANFLGQRNGGLMAA